MSETIKKKGGIQFGGSATTPLSSELDERVQEASHRVADEFAEYSNIIVDHELSEYSADVLGLGKKVSPDGGLWWIDKYPKMAVEAKTQGDEGNAIERWADNFYTCFGLNNDIVYLTFGSGLGFNEGEVCHNFGLRHMEIEARREFSAEPVTRDGVGKIYRYKEFNVLYETGQSWFISDNFTVEDIYKIMKQALLNILNKEK